jgi:ribosomal protein S18 acetylase RimI-like enzyme
MSGSDEQPSVDHQVVVAPEDPTSPDAQRCLLAYFDELDRRFEGGFDAGRLLLARVGGEPVGAGAVKFHGSGPAELKRMWVSSAARGLGIGRRLLAELEARAREHGASAARLETNRSLTEAIRLYRSAGYVEVPAFNDEPYAHHWFEKDLSPMIG